MRREHWEELVYWCIAFFGFGMILYLFSRV